MPKFEPKVVQKELEKGILWPVYWIYGGEKMKARELLKRIRSTVLGEGASVFNEEVLDGTEVSAGAVLDAASALSLGGGPRLVVVRDAHGLKEADQLASLLGPSAAREGLSSVCVFLSKDLDGRKKFSKMLTEKAAVIECAEIIEAEREPWIGYLAKRRGLTLPAEVAARLRMIDPWGLDLVDQELEKYALAMGSGVAGDGAAVLLAGATVGAEAFQDAFLNRRKSAALATVSEFAESPEESLPLMGLLAWNVRHLVLLLTDQERGTRALKLSPFLMERIGRWARAWTLTEAVELQERLAELDFGVKQTARLPLGLWASLVAEFCR